MRFKQVGFGIGLSIIVSAFTGCNVAKKHQGCVSLDVGMEHVVAYGNDVVCASGTAAGKQREIAKWSLLTGMRIAGVPIETPSTFIACSSDQRIVACGLLNGIIHVFDAADLKKKSEVRGLSTMVMCGAISPRGNLLAFGNGDRVGVVDIGNGVINKEIFVGGEMALSAVWIDDDRLAIGLRSGELVEINAKDGSVTRRVVIAKNVPIMTILLIRGNLLVGLGGSLDMPVRTVFRITLTDWKIDNKFVTDFDQPVIGMANGSVNEVAIASRRKSGIVVLDPNSGATHRVYKHGQNQYTSVSAITSSTLAKKFVAMGTKGYICVF